MKTIESINLIYRDPDVRGGRPCIVGTGLRVIDIIMSMQFGNRTPEQIALDYDISLAKVHAALAYYYENRAEIDDDIREDIRIGLELAEEGWGRPEKSLSSRLSPFMQDKDIRSAISDAISASNDERPALVKALFAKMDALELGAPEAITEQAQGSSE